MNGRGVVVVMALAAGAFAAVAWGWGLSVKAEVDAQAEEAGVRRMSREEAAEDVAREDMFGLPSRLDEPPPRDIAVALTAATPEHPLPGTAAGVDELLRLYHVTIKGCRGLLPHPEKDADDIQLYVTLRDVGGVGQIVAVDGVGEGVRDRAFATCVAGGVRAAVFTVPEGSQATTLHTVPLK